MRTVRCGTAKLGAGADKVVASVGADPTPLYSLIGARKRGALETGWLRDDRLTVGTTVGIAVATEDVTNNVEGSGSGIGVVTETDAGEMTAAALSA